MSGDIMHIVFGGAFNPPTIAHQKIVSKLLNIYEEAIVLILPVGDDYRKADLISFHHREQMLKLIFEDFDNVKILDLEQQRPYQGSLKSLDDLSKTYDDLYFVIGADNLQDFESWINYKKLLKSYPFIVMTRNFGPSKSAIEKMFNHLEHHFIWITLDEHISSSQFRDEPNKCSMFLDQKVCAYIKKNKLYEV
jgi:nicotinate-nucleotide adenylyltransferase